MMKNKIIKVSDNSNIELSGNSIEMLMHAACRSIECENFRANNCRMKTFLNSIDGGKWQWSQTWMTPSKFLLHLVATGENPDNQAAELFNDIKDKWACMATDGSCSCDFLDVMKNIKQALETEIKG